MNIMEMLEIPLRCEIKKHSGIKLSTNFYDADVLVLPKNIFISYLSGV